MRIQLNDADFAANDLPFLVDFEMTSLLDMTIEIAPSRPSTPRFTAPARNTWSRNMNSTRLRNCSFRNAGRKSRTTK
jgi:hypothetical protein